METWEIEQRLQELQIKLDYLTERVENNHYQGHGLEVKYEYGDRTRGTKSEIQEVKDQIAQYQQALNIRKANKIKKEEVPKMSSFDYEKQQRTDEIARKKEIEAERIETFKKVKSAYKNMPKHGFEKLVAKLKGTSPKWTKVKNYTQEELEYVLQSLEGRTLTRELAAKRIENRHLDYAIQDKKIKQGNWKSFVEMLNSKGKVQTRMREEEIMKGGYR